MRAINLTMFLLVLMVSATAHGLEPCEVARLEGDLGFGSSFGLSLAIDGDYIVAGDAGDSTMGSLAGAAYIFRRIGSRWEREAKIFGSDIGFMDIFGASVAVQGDRVVVGAPHRDPAGSQWWGYVFVFQPVGGSWVEQQKLISSESTLDDRFGWSVAISGDWIAVGAPRQDNWVGRVFVFRWDGSSYVEEASLSPAPTVQEAFGETVSLQGDRLLVGCPQADAGRGKAYVFRLEGNNWIEEAALIASDGALNDQFGTDVTISGQVAIVGAPATDHAGLSSGSAYIFTRMGTVWTQEANLRASSPQPSGEFGTTVAHHGSYALVGSPGHSSTWPLEDHMGATFLFGYASGTWSEVGSFVPENAQSGIVFGRTLSFDGVNAVVGASSSAYVFGVPTGPPCIPAASSFGLLILASLLVIAGIALLRRGKLNVAHYDDS